MILVIDTSGSMGEGNPTAMYYAKESAKYFAGRVLQNTASRVAVVSFDYQGHVGQSSPSRWLPGDYDRDSKVVRGFTNRINQVNNAINSLKEMCIRDRDYPLESCATIQYILGEVKEVLSIADTRTPSPYNTYLNPGLPPGPVGAPGRVSIQAALYPEDTEYLYFVYKEDGTGEHYFSRTNAEHEHYKAIAAENRRKRESAKSS